MRKGDAAGILPRAHLPVGRIDARRVDVDDDFPASGDRVRQVPVLEDLRAVEENCPGMVPAICGTDFSRSPGTSTPAARATARHSSTTSRMTAGTPSPCTMRPYG